MLYHLKDTLSCSSMDMFFFHNSCSYRGWQFEISLFFFRIYRIEKLNFGSFYVKSVTMASQPLKILKNEGHFQYILFESLFKYHIFIEIRDFAFP